MMQRALRRLGRHVRLHVAVLAVILSLVPAPALANRQFDARTFSEKFVAYGSDNRDRLGLSMAMGDINGDGLADIASGAPLDEKPADPQPNRGALHVYFGAPDLSGSRDAAEAGSPDLIIYGAEGCTGTGHCGNIQGDALGKGVTIGDLNRDGLGDLVVSSVHANPVRAGRVYVFYGRTSWPAVIDLSVAPELANVTIVGDVPAGQYGVHLALGDFDGDGWLDILAGSPATLDSTKSGGMRVVYGGPDLPPLIELSSPPPGVRTFSVYGQEPGDKLGHAVAVADLNGDGLSDFVAGAPRGEGPCGIESGRAKAAVFFGSSAHPLEGAWDLSTTPAPFAVLSGEEGDQMGRRVDAGDVNGDGQADLILPARCGDSGGTTTDAGRTHLLFGPLGAGSRTLSEPADATIEGADAGDFLGVGVGSGDVNGDGLGDLILGADEADGAGNRRRESGELHVFLGPLLPGVRNVVSQPADMAFLGTDSGDRLGRFIAVGDADGDGVGDLGATAYLSRGADNAYSQAGEFYVFAGLNGTDFAPPSVSMQRPIVDELTTATSVIASWSGSDDVEVSSFDLYERIGTEGTQSLIRSSLETSYTRAGSQGTTYCYQVTAHDASGKQGVGEERCASTPLDDRNDRVVYTGDVARISASGTFLSTLTVLSAPGHEAAVSFNGRKFGVMAQKNASSGMLDVWLDGSFLVRLDLYSASTVNRRWALQHSLKPGDHTLRMVWTGERNAASSGTVVRLDAIGFVGD